MNKPDGIATVAVKGGILKVSVLDANSLRKTLLRLISTHEQIYMAVAWAGKSRIADKLIENGSKFKSVTIGLDFCATDPDFVDELCELPNAYVVKKNEACFHPKMYLFLTGRKADAIVGSSNFTAGGLCKNVEACLHISCDVTEAIITELLATMESYAPDRQPVTKQLAETYRRQAQSRAHYPRPPSPILPNEKVDFQRIDSELVKMDWNTFIDEVRKDHHFETRMRFLRYLQTLFAREQTFKGLAVPQWKAIAGIVHPDAVADSEMEMHQIGSFGSMQGSGSFTNLIVNQDKKIAEAVDSIPPRGWITRSDYDRFCELFTSAFAGSARMGRCATATRLLAMKRPDAFVCVNNGNRSSLAEALHFAPSTLSLDNYWDRVIEPIRRAEWYNALRPKGADAEAWDCRAALVDAIYYHEV